MNERHAARGVANAEADFQLSRPFARGLVAAMTRAQRASMRALIFNGILGALEAWEQGRRSRDAAAFYQGTTHPLITASPQGDGDPGPTESPEVR